MNCLWCILLPPSLLIHLLLQASQLEATTKNSSIGSTEFQYKTLEANVMMNCSWDQDCLSLIEKADTLEIDINKAEPNEEEMQKEQSLAWMNWIYVSTGSAVACLFLMTVLVVKQLFGEKPPVTSNPPPQNDFYVEEDQQPARIMVY